MRNIKIDNVRYNLGVKRKVRRVNRFRLLLSIIIFLTIISLVAFVGYRIFEGVSYLYGEYVAIHDSYIERKASQGINVTGKVEGYTNILVMGIDDGVSVDGTEGLHADTIFFISMDLENGRLRIITIPPDTYIENKEGAGRLANFYAVGGAPKMVRAVSDYLRVSVHQYVAINTQALEKLVNVLGGIDIYVEDDMDYDDPEGNISIHIKKGYQTLNGKELGDFLRYRNTALSDTGRMQRQQKFMKALYQKILQIDTVAKLPQIAEIFKTDVDSSAEIFDSAHIASIIRKLSSDPPIVITLPGGYPEGQRIWYPDKEKTEETMKELFPNVSESER